MQTIVYLPTPVSVMLLSECRRLNRLAKKCTLEKIGRKELFLLAVFTSRHGSYNVFIKIIRFKSRKSTKLTQKTYEILTKTCPNHVETLIFKSGNMLIEIK
jgi:hypothetical protein